MSRLFSSQDRKGAPHEVATLLLWMAAVMHGCGGETPPDLEWADDTALTETPGTDIEDTGTHTDTGSSTDTGTIWGNDSPPTGECGWNGEPAQDGVIEPWEAQAQFCGASRYQGLGFSAMGTSDVDGDGRADVVIGTGSGMMGPLVFSGGVSGVPDLLAASARFIYDEQHLEWGASSYGTILGAGDLDLDGYSDLFVSRIEQDIGNRIAYGPILGAVEMINLPGIDPSAYGSVTGAVLEDFDGDGHPDLLFGEALAYQSDGMGENRGAAYVMSGPVTGYVPIEDSLWEGIGPNIDSRAGWIVDSAGDTNGDGLTDIIVSSLEEATVWLILGGAQGTTVLGETDGWMRPDLGDDSYFGWTVSALGDTDGDGLDDYTVSAPLAQGGAADRGGVVWVVPGGVLGEIREEDILARVVGEQDLAEIYALPHALGDVDGDGNPDLFLTGSPYSADPHGWLLLGPLSGTMGESQANLIARAPEGTGPPGIGAWPAGDVDADGRADLLVAMPIANTTYEKAGAVFLFTGAQAVEEMGL